MIIKPRLIKIVRDKVADELVTSRVEYVKTYSTEMIDSSVRKKLMEEVAEYLIDGGIDELCDVLETVILNAEYFYGKDLDGMMKIVEDKRESRGKFDARDLRIMLCYSEEEWAEHRAIIEKRADEVAEELGLKGGTDAQD